MLGFIVKRPRTIIVLYYFLFYILSIHSLELPDHLGTLDVDPEAEIIIGTRSEWRYGEGELPLHHPAADIRDRH